jgi:hypothetical protein
VVFLGGYCIRQRPDYEATKKREEEMRECGKQTRAEDEHLGAKSERSFEASAAGARSGIPRWSGNARMGESWGQATVPVFGGGFGETALPC